MALYTQLSVAFSLSSHTDSQLGSKEARMQKLEFTGTLRQKTYNHPSHFLCRKIESVGATNSLPMALQRRPFWATIFIVLIGIFARAINSNNGAVLHRLTWKGSLRSPRLRSHYRRRLSSSYKITISPWYCWPALQMQLSLIRKLSCFTPYRGFWLLRPLFCESETIASSLLSRFPSSFSCRFLKTYNLQCQEFALSLAFHE